MIRSFKGVRPTVPESCFVDESAQIIGDVVLGEHASVWMNAVVRGDVFAIRIGAHSNIQDCSVLHGMKNVYGVTVGEYVTVGHSVTLHGCVIEDRCLIGDGVDHFEWGEDWGGIDYCGGDVDSGADCGRGGIVVDGVAGEVSAEAGEWRGGIDYAVCEELFGVYGGVFAGAVRGGVIWFQERRNQHDRFWNRGR